VSASRFAAAPRSAVLARRIGIAGLVLAIVAWVITLPPALVRSTVPSVLLALLAITAGLAAWRADERRLGFGAVALGILAVLGAFAATNSGVGHLKTVFTWSAQVAAMLRYATPLLFAALGGIISERSGVINIGLEGMMLMGAFFGIWGADVLNSWVLGVLVAMAAGGLLALVHAIFSIHLRSNQVVSGTVVNFLALGITGYFFFQLYHGQDVPLGISTIPRVHIPYVKDWHFLGPAIGNLNLMVWLSFLLVIVSYIVVFKTPIGLRIRACGEHPRAADTVGINVYAIRYGSVVVSGILAALGGAYLSIGFGGGTFTDNMTAGRGFIALAAMIFGNWRPFGAFGAALLFGFSTALAYRLPVYSGTAATLFQTLPYVLTLIAVAGVIGRTVPPAADGRPYKRQ